MYDINAVTLLLNIIYNIINICIHCMENTEGFALFGVFFALYNKRKRCL